MLCLPVCLTAFQPAACRLVSLSACALIYAAAAVVGAPVRHNGVRFGMWPIRIAGEPSQPFVAVVAMPLRYSSPCCTILWNLSGYVPL